MYKSYFKTAWRYLTRNRVSSIINIFGLSLGIAGCLIIFLITKHEFSFDTFHPDRERIYRLISERESIQRSSMIHQMLHPLRDEITGLESVAMTFLYEGKVRISGEGEEKYFEAPRRGIDPFDVVITDPAYFDIFQYEWLAGIPASLNEPYMVALTTDKAYKYFGDLPVDEYIGKEITYGDALRVMVAGIVKPWTKNTKFIYTDFISKASISGSELNRRYNMGWGAWDYLTQVYVKLLPGVEPATVEAQFPAWAGKYVILSPGVELKLSLQPFSDIHFDTAVEDDYLHRAHLPTLYGLMAIAAFILIIAACNFINLSTAQSFQRTKEIGVRKVLGGKRNSIIIQLLGETLLVTSFAAIFALLLTNITIDIFHFFAPQGIVPQGLSLDLTQPFTWLFLLTVVTCTTLLSGFFPAKLLSGVAPVSIMKGGSQRGSTKSLLRKSLIVFQFTISLTLIICTLVVGNQIHYMMNKDLGFDNKEAILNIRINRVRDNRDVLVEKIKQFPYVEMVSVHTAPPAALFHNGTRFVSNINGEEREVFGSIEFCDENFIPFYGLRLIAGRNLFPSPYMREFVINESFARQLGFTDPQDAIGQFIVSGQVDRILDDPASTRRPIQIVGVVSDFHLAPLYENISPMAISATSGHQELRTLSVKVHNAGNMKRILADMELTWKELYPYERLEMTFYDDAIAAFYEKERKTAQITGAAMFLAILISCMGLFGLAVFTTKRRTKEIGIRKVLGASKSEILALISGEFVKLVIIASVIASPLAWYAMNKWLDVFAYRAPLHWWLFVVAGTIAVVIAWCTVGAIAYRAAIENPVKAIMSE